MKPSHDSDRGRALDALRVARNPHQLFRVLADVPAARDPDLVADLARDAGATENPDLAQLRTNQACELAQLFDSANRASHITNLDQLVELADDRHLVFSGLFWEVIKLLANDAADRGEASRASGLRACLAINEGVWATLVRLNAFLATRDAHTELPQEFCDPAFLGWLRLYQRALVRTDPKGAASTAAIRDYLITRMRTSRAIRNAKTDDEGRIRIQAEGLTDVWHLLRLDVNEPFAELARQLADPGCSVEECVLGALHLTKAATPNAKIYWGAYFLQCAFRDGPIERTAELLRSYRRLVDTESTGVLEKATVALRFALALNVHWKRAHEPRETLLDALSLLDNALNVVPAERTRFLRDLHFARARTAENISTWEAAYLETAASSLRLGLEIAELDHDRNARGSALGDLGNVLSKLAARRGSVEWQDVDAVFEEALSHLSDSNWNRAIVLSNFAISLMDRPTGDRATNVERSLDLADKALLVAQNGEATEKWMQEAHAGMHLTRGNALRERAYGSRPERLQAARETFMRGYRVAPEGSQVSGLLRLNQALVATELSLTEEALRCFDEAGPVVSQNPVFAAVTSFAEHMTQVQEPGALDSVRSAVKRLDELGATREVSWRASWLARQVWHLGEDGRREAAKLLETSLAHYRTLGDAEGIVETLRTIAALELTEPASLTPEQLARAECLLEEARHHAEALWRRQPTIEWRLSRAHVTTVCAELAWVRAVQAAPVEDIIAMSCLAKDREFLEHTKLLAAPVVNAAAEEAIALARALEMQRWRAQNDAAPTESVLTTHEETEHLIAEARLTEALLVGRYDDVKPEAVHARLAEFFDAHPNALVLDFTPCKWGTVVLMIDATGKTACVAPLREQTLEEFAGSGDGWASAYARWSSAAEIERPAAWTAWQEATNELLGLLQRELIQPAIDHFGPFERDRDLVIVPGSLAGMPLHAVPVAGGARLADAVGSVAYAASLARLPTETAAWKAPQNVLCILSDPPREGRKPLTESPNEIARVAKVLSRRGATVQIVSSFGGVTGHAGHGALSSVDFSVRDEPPSPEVFAELVPSADALIYSGHGSSTGLLLAAADGSADRLTCEHVLTMKGLSRRPFVHLSACSTAQGGASRTDMFNFASCLLRIGARAVVAGLWELRDEQAARFSHAFYEGAADGVLLARLVAAAAQEVRKAVGDGEVLTWAPFILLLGP